MKQRLLNILFWSVLAAAFIGPGTVTTAARAGAGFGYALIWALVFSTLACFVLQEASARITVASGSNLGEALRAHYSRTAPGRALVWLALVAILTGCAAYEAGNILGAVSGLRLLADLPVWLPALALGAAAGCLLWHGSLALIARLLGGIVALMGLCFLSAALLMGHDLRALLLGALTPTLPAGSEVLVLGLIGTTVVPYNLFLGSGLKHAQALGEMRISLFVAIALGGVISIGVLLVGTALAGDFAFEHLADTLAGSLGGWAAVFFALGLFAAGFSSTLTAALAGAITARSILGRPEQAAWKANGRNFRLVWLAVLGIGVGFGASNTPPVPAIILAQALNGLILPIIAVLLLLLVNRRALMGERGLNGPLANAVMLPVVFATLLIGLNNVFRALSAATPAELADEALVFRAAVLVALVITGPVLYAAHRGRQPAKR